MSGTLEESALVYALEKDQEGLRERLKSFTDGELNQLAIAVEMLDGAIYDEEQYRRHDGREG